LRETLAEGGLESYLIMAEEMGEEYSPTDLAAAAFKLLLGMPLEEAEDKLAEVEPVIEEREGRRKGRRERDRDRESDRDRGRQRGRDHGDFGPEPGMSRLFIDIGRDDGIRPGDIVGAIANEASIPGRAIGVIELYEHFSFVEVPSNLADRVMGALKQTTIRGRKISPSHARPKRERR
jgi:ATP-dependent RNA helicase DeaD